MFCAHARGLPGDNSKVGRLKTGAHEQHNVFVSYHTQHGHFLQEFVHVFFCRIPPSMDHDVTVPSSPKSTPTLTILLSNKNQIKT